MITTLKVIENSAATADERICHSCAITLTYLPQIQLILKCLIQRNIY